MRLFVLCPLVLALLILPVATPAATQPKSEEDKTLYALGLAISHRIIREAGGLLEVDTTAGEGTTFRILLPAL